jgi:uncharacterized protein (DUF1697 family)
MALVVFLRGANVGGHRTFQPSAFAKDLADLDVVNVGAAGTFVVRKAASQAKVRAEFLRRLPVETELMICPGRDLLDLAGREPFPEFSSPGELSPFVSIMARCPRSLPPLPLIHPSGANWQVKIVGVTGPFALSLLRRLGPRNIYPNEVVEKKLGVAATTRNWNTITAVAAILRGD